MACEFKLPIHLLLNVLDVLMCIYKRGVKRKWPWYTQLILDIGKKMVKIKTFFVMKADMMAFFDETANKQ